MVVHAVEGECALVSARQPLDVWLFCWARQRVGVLGMSTGPCISWGLQTPHGVCEWCVLLSAGCVAGCLDWRLPLSDGAGLAVSCAVVVLLYNSASGEG